MYLVGHFCRRTADVPSPLPFKYYICIYHTHTKTSIYTYTSSYLYTFEILDMHLIVHFRCSAVYVSRPLLLEKYMHISYQHHNMYICMYM